MCGHKKIFFWKSVSNLTRCGWVGSGFLLKMLSCWRLWFVLICLLWSLCMTFQFHSFKCPLTFRDWHPNSNHCFQTNRYFFWRFVFFISTVINYAKNAAAKTTTSTNYNRLIKLKDHKTDQKVSNCNITVILGKTIRQHASCRITDQKESLSLHYKRMSTEYLTCCLVSSIILLLMMFPCFRSVHFPKRENIFHFRKSDQSVKSIDG